MQYLVFDFDSSAVDEGASAIPLQQWQERIRFGCSWNTFREFSASVEREIPAGPALINIGSGDYHHVSYLLVERLRKDRKYHLVVFDNHPDNMIFPFGIHCGSWVYHASKLPHIAHVTVVGITSGDIRGMHLLENHWSPILKHKLTYCAPVGAASSEAMGWFPHAFRKIELDDGLAQVIRSIDPNPIYLSIDKDVLSKDEIETNWDQGVMTSASLLAVIKELRGTVVGGDITGEISFYHYRSWWKRFLSRLDGQVEMPEADLIRLQGVQRQLNRKIADLL